MNTRLHRVLFNAARGLRMVVQETARSMGKANGTTPAVAAAALLGVLTAVPGQAQIVGAPNVPGSLRPTVLVAPNGTPLVQIQTPSAAGVSRNIYQRFDVGAQGVILNNSRTNVADPAGRNSARQSMAGERPGARHRQRGQLQCALVTCAATWKWRASAPR